MKKGFTLAEAMVTLVIVGILTSLTISVIFRTESNHNNILYKKAFHLTEKVVGDLTQNSTLYPNGLLSTPTSGNFCSNFVSRLSVIDTINCVNNNGAAATPNFTTSDGISWWFYPGSFPNVTVDPVTIWVDVNGWSYAPDSASGANQDIFKILISPNGKVTTPPGIETTFMSQ